MLVTNGGKQALYNTFAALLDPGDEVLLPAPYWTTYPESITLAGGTPVVVPTTVASGFRATIDQLEAACTPRTKALRVRVAVEPERCGVPARRGRGDRTMGASTRASGSSPTRSTSTSPSASTRSRRCRCSCPSSPTRCVVVNGVAKTYAMTGWRVGWMIGPVDVVKAATNLQSHSTSNVADVSQRAALAALNGDLSAVAMMRAAFERRGRTMYELLNAIPGVTAIEPQGAFYGFPSLEGVLGSLDSRANVAHDDAELQRGAARRGEGGDRARRGVRRARLRPPLVRPQRRRHRRGHHEDREAPDRVSTSSAAARPESTAPSTRLGIPPN